MYKIKPGSTVLITYNSPWKVKCESLDQGMVVPDYCVTVNESLFVATFLDKEIVTEAHNVEKF